MVEHLSQVVMDAIENEAKDDTSAADILSAIFTVLHRTLRALEPHQAPEEAIYNRQQVSKVLNELLAEHGILVH